MGSWANITTVLLELIVEKIAEHTDILRFGSVCKQWHSVVVDHFRHIPRQLPLCHCFPYQHPLPLLMQCSYGEETGKLKFFSLADQKLYGEFIVPEINRKWICGSTNGWLVTIEINGRQIYLLNPFTRARIQLPSPLAFEHPNGDFDHDYEYDDFGFLRKTIICSSGLSRHLNNDCMVVSIISNLHVLSFTRVGGDKWTNIKGSPIHLGDVIYYKGQLFAVNFRGVVVAFDIQNDFKVTIIGGITDFYMGTRYLVESSSGDLLQVIRVMDEELEEERTIDFVVFKLEAVDEVYEVDAESEYAYIYQTVDHECFKQHESRFKWVELNSLGDEMLFLGLNCSLSLPANLYPGCRKNCIYFTDDRYSHVAAQREVAYLSDLLPYDMGVFDMEEQSIKHLRPKDLCLSVPPIWVVPDPW